MRQLLAFCLILLLQTDQLIHIRSAESAAVSPTAESTITGLPDLQEIFNIIETRLGDISKEDLEHAALQGILTEFQTKIELETPSHPGNNITSPPSLAKKELLGKDIVYLRVAEINESTAQKALESIELMRVKTKPTGLILDLRYTGGSNYAAALNVASLFLDESVPFLNWGAGLKHIPAGGTRIDLPVVMLVNEATAGAAEALAGGLQLAKVGPLVGRKTTGNVQSRQRVPLSSGHFLVIASGNVQLADGTTLTDQGIQPDILVDVSPAVQAALFDDPYGKLNQSSGTAAERMNEAALMRRQKENGGAEIDINAPPTNEEETSPAPKAIKDPILARGVDILTGWNVFSKLNKP